MSATAVLRPRVVEFVKIRAKNEKKTTKEKLERAFEYGRDLAEKHGFTEEDVNNEIEAYRREECSL
ncbi:MAG: hypothetical protein LBQ87_03315 [Candidatus Fibromonas sp.]|jgi:hypothetical protein|nr:hypothetical protein [Candidatus Fibromonas sp.]